MADWVFDSVVGFLYSPMWTVPIVNFIEHKCLVFDPEEDNQKVYAEIHGEYKELVEFLLENFLEDVGISTDQFVTACKKKDGKHSDETYAAFEQVEAAQDYEVFKRMMIQKNIELELQALRLIQERNGVIPESMTPSEKSSVQYSQARVEDEEERILQEVLRKSKEEYEAQERKKGSVYDKEMEKALANSKDEAQRLRDETEREKDMLEKALKMSLASETAAKSQTTLKDMPAIATDTKKPEAKNTKPEATKTKTPAPVPTIQEPSPAPTPAPAAKKKDVSSAEAAASWLSSAKAEAEASRPGSTASRTDAHSKKLASSDAAEIKRREDYLKQQRDRLLAMKKKEREKSLDTFTASSQGRDRPRSARAAKQAIKEEGKPQSAEMSAEDRKKLAMRQALAERLKQEVINKK